MRSFYDIIEVEENEPIEKIKKAYFDFLRKVHPDKSEGPTDVELLNTVTLIWNRIKVSTGKLEYDCWLREQRLRETKGTIAERIEIEEGDEEIVDEPCRCGDNFQVSAEEVKQIVDIGIFEYETSTKILVLGDSCVGKTTFCHCVAGEIGQLHSSTIGATVTMAWHEYRVGTPEQRTELLELWDIGGMMAHRQNSQVFFEGAVGAILVHDLTNKKSEENLASWLTMLDGKPRGNSKKDPAAVALRVDIESCNIPVLIVGTKADLVPHKGPVSYDRLHIDSTKNIIKGSANSITLSRFFDSCLDRTRRTSLNDSDILSREIQFITDSLQNFMTENFGSPENQNQFVVLIGNDVIWRSSDKLDVLISDILKHSDELNIYRENSEVFRRFQKIQKNYIKSTDLCAQFFVKTSFIFIEVEINQEKLKALVDTGAQLSIISKNFAEKCRIFDQLDTRFAVQASGIGGNRAALGKILFVECLVSGNSMRSILTVVEELDFELIIGIDFLKAYNAMIDLKNQKIVFDQKFDVKFLLEDEEVSK
ncbi:unnamed protein product [Caenorhabditis angaria]|uniref:J domain-containing protein n=1 Tax=Caenorhabditis angaria TaxID=860376 RepID=A0A9P1N4D0_9PELO|nr:unnamed protein product [Caenorhabditis angaria]